jgi:predicted nucleic acid-binding protein
MNAVDTNILFYAKDMRETVKQPIAESLIQTLLDGVLIWQVATEYIAITRKLEPLGYNRKKAFDDLRLLRSAWKTILPSWAVLDRAENLINRYSVSSWDALIIAACLENGVTKLYTEDIADNFRKEGIEIINPFQIQTPSEKSK